MTTTKLWNRDFSLLIFGQVISLFGNMILSFALPLYILYISGSAALFGLVLGLTHIPLLIMSPIGGMIADRFRKQRIMFWLDASTTLLILAYIAASGFVTAVLPIVIVKLMALNAIQGVYMPAVSASVPLLATGEKLVSANAVVNLVNSLSGMAGMAIAGLLFAEFGLFPILAVSAVCFAITAVMDLLIRIPFKPQPSSGGIIKTAKGDLLQSVKFMKEKSVIIKCAVVAFMLSFTLISLILVGVPVLVTQHLHMGMEFVGISQSIMMSGGIVGGIAAGVLGSKLKIDNAYFPVMMSGIVLIPVGIAFTIGFPYFLVYVILTAACAVAFAFVTIANIQVVSLIQTKTPTELTGKVMSIVVMLPLMANALGQLIYGIAFEYLAAVPYVLPLVTAGVVVVIAFYARSSFKIYSTSPDSCEYEVPV